MQDSDDEVLNGVPELQLQAEGDDSAGRPRVKTAIGIDDSRSSVSLYEVTGDHIGIMSMKEALAVANDRGLRLFVVGPDSVPLVAQLLKLRAETFAVRIFPHTNNLSATTSKRYAIVLHIKLAAFDDSKSMEDLAERLYLHMVNHFGVAATELLSQDKAAQLAEEIWKRGFNR